MSEEMKKCPYCGKTVLAVARKCKYCGKFFNTQKQNYKAGIICAVLFGVIVIISLLFALRFDEDIYNENVHYEGEQASVQNENVPTNPKEFAKHIQNKVESMYLTEGVDGYERGELLLAAQNYILEEYAKKDCLLKLNNICFKPLVVVPSNEYMSFKECMSDGPKYGITDCRFAGKYGGLAKKCGGIQNLPTMAELRMLSDYLYNIKAEDCFKYDDYSKKYDCINKYASGYPINEDNDLFQEYFLLMYPFQPNNSLEYSEMQEMFFQIGASDRHYESSICAQWFSRDGTKPNPEGYSQITLHSPHGEVASVGMCVSRD